MHICNLCGKTVEDDNVDCKYDYSRRITEVYTVACECGGELVRATECKICGEWFAENGNSQVCDDCIDNYQTVSTAIEFGSDPNSAKSVEINHLVATLLSEEQINKILCKFVEENFVDYSKPIKDYFSDCFCDYLEFIEHKYGR